MSSLALGEFKDKEVIFDKFNSLIKDLPDNEDKEAITNFLRTISKKGCGYLSEENVEDWFITFDVKPEIYNNIMIALLSLVGTSTNKDAGNLHPILEVEGVHVYPACERFLPKKDKSLLIFHFNKEALGDRTIHSSIGVYKDNHKFYYTKEGQRPDKIKGHTSLVMLDNVLFWKYA